MLPGQDLLGLTESEYNTLKDMVAKVRKLSVPKPISGETEPVPGASEVYLALPPCDAEDGIPAADPDTGVPGYKECCLFRLDPEDPGDPGNLAKQIKPMKVGTNNVRKVIYNIYPTRANRCKYIVVRKTKFGVWVCDRPDGEPCPGDPDSTTTTTPAPTTTTTLPPDFNVGRCGTERPRWTYSLLSGRGVWTTDEPNPCATPTTTPPPTTTTGEPTSTTTGEPTSTTTGEPTTTTTCACPPNTTTTGDPATSSSTSSTTTTTEEPTTTTPAPTTTTEEPCRPVPPNFCGWFEGQCTLTYCTRMFVGTTPECTTSTTSTSTSTSEEPTTTPECVCPTLAGCSECTAYIDPITGSQRLENGCREGLMEDGTFCYCPITAALADPVECVPVTAPCQRYTPITIPPEPCRGNIGYICLGFNWARYLGFCSGTCPNSNTPSLIGCHVEPPPTPCDCGAYTERGCFCNEEPAPPATTTTIAPCDPIDCDCRCRNAPPPTTTTTEAPCLSNCLWQAMPNPDEEDLSHPFVWSNVQNPCTGSCPCRQPDGFPAYDCQTTTTRCASAPPTTTTVEPPTTPPPPTTVPPTTTSAEPTTTTPEPTSTTTSEPTTTTTSDPSTTTTPDPCLDCPAEMSIFFATFTSHGGDTVTLNSSGSNQWTGASSLTFNCGGIDYQLQNVILTCTPGAGGSPATYQLEVDLFDTVNLVICQKFDFGGTVSDCSPLNVTFELGNSACCAGMTMSVVQFS